MISTADLYSKFLSTSGICTDTRAITKGCMFVALKGDNFNGNNFAHQAIADGAKYALVDESEKITSSQTILVDDGLKALTTLAVHHRKQLNIPVIGITGSNGKTTTKELIKACLEPKYKVHATAGNFNNHIGVPLTILSTPADTEIAIIEMGANHVGEIAALSEISQPTHGIITNIGRAHLEGFGGFDGVIRAKSELYQYLIKTNGTVFINSADPVLANMAKRFQEPIFYPKPQDYYSCSYIDSNPFVKINTASGEVATHLIGAYNFSNIATALCIAKFFNVPDDKAENALASYVPSNNRSQVIKQNSNTIIMDAYNANPSSMSAALENFSKMSATNKVVILGDMFELGSESMQEHINLGKMAESLSFDQVYFCGKESAYAAKACKGSLHFDTREELGEHLKNQSITDSIILLKASRGIGLEAIVPEL